ncbi:MAG TPA: NAD-dependent epimerase/dehydratase family protein [Verrucomicrobiae bacterium]|nr:NAD-dependent epimerase/dehydratase family protein [Verrucomicrobiae bacterium]
MKVLVTGGAGFIGHHLVHALLERGHELAVIDDFRTGRHWRLAGVLKDIRLVEGDVRDPSALDRAVAGCEVVLHEAALPSVAMSIRDPRLSSDINVGGTVEMMLAAGRAGVRRVVFAGSSSIYGADPRLPRLESHMPDPRSPYAVNKLAGEQMVHVLGALHGIESVVLRYFNIFGPGQDPNSEYAPVVPAFIMAGLHGEQPTIYGDGLQSRDFTFIDNVVSANLLAATVAGASGTTCNIGCGGRYSLRDLLNSVAAAIGHPIAPLFEEPRVGDVRDSQASIELAQERLGYQVTVPFEEGVRRTVSWYRDAPADLLQRP